MAHGKRVAASAASDDHNPAHQQLEGDGSQEPSGSGSGTADNEGSTQPTTGPGERHAPLMPLEVAARLDPEFLQRYYDAYARIQRRRMEGELEQMAMEEADDSRQFYASIGGVQYNPPREPSVTSTTSFRSGKPPTYGAKDEKEWRSFINWWKVVFKEDPEAWPEEKRIAKAAMEFRGKPLDEWAVIEEDKQPKTWSQFETWTRNLLSDPENRMQNARLKIRELRQKKGQTVRDINNMLELWERDLDEAPSEVTKAYSTFLALHPDLRNAISTETHGKITTREQVTSIAQRHAERMTLSWDESTGGQPSRKRKRSDGATQGKDKDKDDSSATGKASKKRRAAKADDKDTKDIVCWDCGEPGHKKPDCPNPKANTSDKQSKNSKAQP
jgi:Zinc knuckle